MQLKDLGWNSFFAAHFENLKDPSLTPARVVEELKGFLRVRSEKQEYLAEVAGKIRYQAEDRDDLPAVGDWVAITPRGTEDRARINVILPRKSKLSRKVAGRDLSEQIVGTNLDKVFVVSSLNREFNVRRMERYLTVVWESGAQPIVLLNKADLCEDAAASLAQVESISSGAAVHLLSARDETGIDAVQRYLVYGETSAFIGSSGVGKSTIINALSGGTSRRVQPVHSDDRGRHTTTSRQMIFLQSGAIVIDTPGMRELQLWESGEGAAQVFDDISQLAQGCKFRDCSHRGEPHCAVEEAILNGLLDRERLESQRKMQQELLTHERKVDVQAARLEKEKWKKLTKAIRKRPDIRH